MLHVLKHIYFSKICPLCILSHILPNVIEFLHVSVIHFGETLFIAICFRRTFTYMLFIALVTSYMSLVHTVWVLQTN